MGYFGGAAGGAVSIYQWNNGEISGEELTADLIMTGVGFLGPIGAGVSIFYFVILKNMDYSHLMHLPYERYNVYRDDFIRKDNIKVNLNIHSNLQIKVK